MESATEKLIAAVSNKYTHIGFQATGLHMLLYSLNVGIYGKATRDSPKLRFFALMYFHFLSFFSALASLTLPCSSVLPLTLSQT